MVNANASILGLLESGLDPTKDHDQFPKIPLGGDDGDDDSGFTLAFGLADNVFGSGEPEPKKVARAIEVLAKGDEAASERAFDGLKLDANLEQAVDGFSPEVRAAVAPNALAILRATDSYEIAKWMTLLAHLHAAGDNGLDDEQVSRLMLLGRHPEFTATVTLLLSIASDTRPERLRSIIDLAPHVHGWGLVDLINRRRRYDSLKGDPEIDRTLLVNVMRNLDGLGMELAFPLAETIGLKPWVDAASAGDADPEIRQAVATWLATLIDEPEPCGGIDDVDDGSALLRAWCSATIERSEIGDEERLALASAARHVREADDGGWADRLRARASNGLLLDDLVSRARNEDGRAQQMLCDLEPDGTLAAALRDLGDTVPSWWVQRILSRHAGQAEVQDALLSWLERSSGLKPVPLEARDAGRRFPVDDAVQAAGYMLRELGGAPADRLRPLTFKALQTKEVDPRWDAMGLLLNRHDLIDGEIEAVLRSSLALEHDRQRVRVILVDSRRASFAERVAWFRDVRAAKRAFIS